MPHILSPANFAVALVHTPKSCRTRATTYDKKIHSLSLSRARERDILTSPKQLPLALVPRLTVGIFRGYHWGIFGDKKAYFLRIIKSLILIVKKS